MFSASATTPSPMNAASPCTATGARAWGRAPTARRRGAGARGGAVDDRAHELEVARVGASDTATRARRPACPPSASPRTPCGT
jgi:hypothetical protein